MLKLNKLMTIVLVLLSPSFAYSSLYSFQSGTTNLMEVGESEPMRVGPFKTAGHQPSVGLHNVSGGIKIEFSSLIPNATIDEHHIYTIQSDKKHDDIEGIFHFAKIKHANVFFGDWAQTLHLDDASYQTFAVGKNITTYLPINNASYSVVGISQYNGFNLLSGTFHVDFLQKTFTGDLVNSIRYIQLRNGVIHNIDSTITFSASAIETGVFGVLEGAFFGNEAEVLAGVIAFSTESSRDVGFGGSKHH